jgi:hypothetical protein
MANRNHNVEQDANMSTTARSLITCDVPGNWPDQGGHESDDRTNR